MSWSIYALGKVPAVAKKVEEEMAKIGYCQEPEESVRQQAGKAILTALNAYPGDKVVHVEASGHQDSVNEGKGVNYLQVKIEPKGYFLE
jgi:hypothetical protein